ncbi:MAG TPA: histone deacetylase [Candidatus Angelobacter sp.]|nr:histone deacetylase [Candidatus Angelobacter sp.]
MARLFFTDHYLITLPEGHKFPSRKYGLVRDLLGDDGRFQFEPAPIPASEVIQLAHDPNYVRSFLAGSLPAASMRRIGLPWSDVLVKRALASVGGTLCAAQDALKFGWGGTLGGGTHHAFRSEGAGFCIFNDIAVTIQFLRTTGLIRNAAVIDLDVHQGDGTAEIFRDDPEVFTLSIHCNSNFPFRKQQSTLDVALRDGVEDEEYLDRLNEVLPQVLDWHPEIVFYQSGVDGLATDVLGHLALTHEGLIARDRLVMESMRQSGIPLVLTSGGGYSRPIELSADAHANTYRTAWQVFAAEPTADVGSFAAKEHRD